MYLLNTFITDESPISTEKSPMKREKESFVQSASKKTHVDCLLWPQIPPISRARHNKDSSID